MEVRYTFKYFILCLIGCLFYSLNSHAQTIQVTNTLDSGTGSLREAINTANTNPGADTIVFVFSTAPFYIKPMFPLPALTDDSTVIDATIGGHNPGDVEIEGNASSIVDGLVIQGNHCQVYGMYIYHCNEAGIEINSAKYTIIGSSNKPNYFAGNSLEGVFCKNAIHTTIQHNFLGTNSTLSTTIGNYKGIVIDGSDSVFVSNNLIVSNNFSGISIVNAQNIEIKQNNIGLSTDNVTAMGNNGAGIHIEGATSNVNIGGSSADANSIAFNSTNGVFITGGAYNCSISQNKIYCNNNDGISLNSGSNQNMTAPVITFPTTSSITGTSTFGGATIEVFSHDSGTCAGVPCQGRTFLGSTTTTGTGDWTLTGSFPSGISVTATATNNNNTSPFSTCLIVTGGSLCPSDSLALVDLYNATNGGMWTYSWNLSQPMSTWYGVTLNGSGCVSGLNLNNNNLNGVLIDLNLPNTNNIDLGNNNLTGSIPNFSYLANTQVLNLYNNQLSGTLPNFSNLTTITQLTLNNNNLNGSIPDFSGMSTLTQLFLGENNLSGNIPNFSNLFNLNILSIPDNQLDGNLPNFTSLYSLSQLYLQNNRLSGNIPDFISTPNLQTLRLNDNEFQGTIPDFQAYTLNSIYLGKNHLDSCKQFTILSTLSVLDIEKNDLTFDDILNNWGIAGNYVYDKQDSVGNIQNINLNVGDNYTYKLDFDETVSSNEYQWYKDGTVISGATSNQLSLSNVVLTDAGKYDCRITNLTATGETLEIKPIFISVTSPCRQSDSLELVSFYNATNGPNWTISWNLNQPMNTWQGVYLNAAGCVDSLILSNNNLSGSLPNLNLGSIKFLSLENNALTGNIINFDKMPALRFLSLSDNSFNGTMPSFNNLINLKVINLSSNSLNGTIPDLSSLPLLELLDLEDNQLTGFTNNFANNPFLKLLDVSDNQLVGNVPNFSGASLETIKLDHNQLSGAIPDFNLSNLKELYLQFNQFDYIPDFYYLSNLEKLLIGDNDFSFLPQFSNLGNLEVIDAKNNKLTFDNIIPNLNNTSLTSLIDFVYAPQDSVGIKKTVQLTSCESYAIFLNIDGDLNTNQYAWSKNGNWISTTSTDTLHFPSIKSIDAGIYTSAITNPNAPNLTLYSRPVTIQVSPPTLTYCPNNIKVNTAPNDCQQIVNWTEPTAVDFNGTAIAYTFRSHTPGSDFLKDTTNIKYVFCEHPDTLVCEFKVIVEDNEDPVFHYFPNDTTVYINSNICQKTVSWTQPIFSDNCPDPIVSVNYPSGSSFPKGITTINYTISDSSGNAISNSFSITVQDTVPPIYTYFPNDTTVYANAACQNTVTWSTPIGIDNCGAVLSSTSDIANGTNLTRGTHTVTYTLYDSSGNNINQSFNITVLDTIKPTFSYFPNDTTVNASSGCAANVTWTNPIAIDNCSANTPFSSTPNGSSFNAGETYVVYTVYDDAQNQTIDSFKITVVDNTPPYFSYFPNDTTINVDANSCDAVVTWNMPIGNDDCGNTNLISNQMLSTFPKGDTEIIYTLTDEAGNTTKDTLTITVQDSENPTVTYFPNDTTVYINSNCDVPVSWNSPIFYDNCDANPQMSASIPSGSIFQAGNTTVTYTFSDIDGNETEEEFIITVLDTIKPTINNCPIDTIFSCQNQVFWTVPTATDNCTPTALINTTNPNYNPGDNFPIGATNFQYIFTDTSGNSSICNVVVYVYPPLTSNTSSTIVSCAGGNDGTATVSPTNGLAPYTYAWNTIPTQPTATATNLTVGTYEVTITDANGCTSTESVTVNEPTAIFTNVSLNNNVNCNGANDGSATVVATGGTAPFTYLWDNGELTATANQLNGGMRFVTVTDANGCTKLDSISIFEPAIMGSTLTIDSLSCNQLLGQPNDGKIVAMALNGLAPYTYQWTNNVSTTQTADNLGAGTYSVTITDANGCTATNTGIVHEPPILQVGVTIDQPTDCQGGANGIATVNVTGGNPSYSYQWSNSSTATTVSNLSPGIHSVTVTDYGGCMIGSTFNMTQFPAIDKDSIRKTDITCTNSSGVSTNDGTGSIYMSSGTLPYNYIWTNGNTTSTATNLTAGQHFVTVTDATGCTWIDSVMIGSPPSFVVNTNASSDTCGLSQGQIQTTVTGGTFGYTYNWNTGQTSPNLNNIANGSYDLTVTDANGCTEIINNIIVGNTCDSCVLFTPISFITTNQFEYTCLGNGQAEVMISVQGGKPEFDGFSDYTLILTGSSVNGENGTYKDPSGIFSFIINDGDNWNISITDDLNCSVVSLDELFTESLNACPNFCDLYPVVTTISNDTVVLFGDDAPLSISGGFTYNWFPSNSLSCSDCANPVATPNQTTTYTVISTDLNGCTATDTVNVMITIVPDPNIFVKYNNGITGNQDGKNDNLVFENLHLYPKNELVIFNRYGNIVYQVSPYQNEWNGTYQGIPLPEGVYYFILRTDLNNTETLRGSVTIVK